jgi:hypothetical protein
MPKEIFDQHRPRSAKARRLDEAFAGCEEWTLAPPSPRRSTLEVAPWLASRPPMTDRSALDSLEERRAA